MMENITHIDDLINLAHLSSAELIKLRGTIKCHELFANREALLSYLNNPHDNINNKLKLLFLMGKHVGKLLTQHDYQCIITLLQPALANNFHQLLAGISKQQFLKQIGYKSTAFMELPEEYKMTRTKVANKAYIIKLAGHVILLSVATNGKKVVHLPLKVLHVALISPKLLSKALRKHPIYKQLDAGKI